MKAAGTSNAHDEGACYRIFVLNFTALFYKSLGPDLRYLGFKRIWKTPDYPHMQVDGRSCPPSTM